MDHAHEHAHDHEQHAQHRRPAPTKTHTGNAGHGSLNRIAFVATLHCLSGCAIGEVLGMVLGTALGLSNLQTIALAVALAFISGYLLTMLPLLRTGMSFGAASRLALAADTASIAIMEIVDNAIMLVVPGAMDAPLSAPLFWGSLGFALIVAGVAAYPVNRWLIRRGKGHAVVHAHHWARSRRRVAWQWPLVRIGSAIGRIGGASVARRRRRARPTRSPR